MSVPRIGIQIGLGIGILAAAPSVVRAQGNASDQAAAQGLFDEGLRLFGQEKYSAACDKFEASLELVAAMGTRGKLAECHEKVGRTASAWAAYRKVAVLAGRSGQTRRQKVATERAARLEPLLSYVTVMVPQQAQVEGLRITRNGVSVPAGIYGTAVAVDPGNYNFEASAPGYESWALEVVVGTTVREAVEITSLTKLPEPDIHITEFPGPSGPSQIQKTNTTKKLVGMAGMGTGAALFVGGIALGLSANEDYNSAFDEGHCNAGNVCSDEGVRITDDARSKANFATVLSVSGIAVAGIGAYFWLTSDEMVSVETAVQVIPTGGPDTVGFSVLGTF